MMPTASGRSGRRYSLVALACLFVVPAVALGAPVRIIMEWGGGDRTRLVWDGEIAIEGGRLVGAEDHLMDGEPEGYYDLTDRGVKFRGFTEGATDGIIISVEGPATTRVLFSSPVKALEFRLFQAMQAPFTVQVNDQGAFVSVGAAPGSSIETPRQECRCVVAAREKGRSYRPEADRLREAWTVGVETDGPETSMDSRQKIVLGRWTEDAWESVADVAGPGVLYFPSAAADAEGGVWIAWCQLEAGNWDVYARHFDGEDLAPPERLSDSDAADLLPCMLVTPDGPLVAWEVGERDSFSLVARRREGEAWGPTVAVTAAGDLSFRPVMAEGTDGTVWIAYDAFDRATGDYDVFLRALKGEEVSPAIPVLASNAEEMDPSIALDHSGVVWVVASGRCVGVRDGRRVLPPEGFVEAARIDGIGPTDVAVDGAGRLWLFAARPGGRNRQPLLRAAFVSDGAPPMTGGAAIDMGWRPPLVQADGTLWLSTETALARLRVPVPSDYAAGPAVDTRLAPSEDALHTKDRALPPAPEPRQVTVDGTPLNVYYGELHTHLSELPTDRIIRTWIDRFYTNARHVAQLDVASVSDHDWPPMTLSKFAVEQAFAAALDDPGEFAACVGWEWSGDGPIRFRYGDRTVVFVRDYSDILRITDERGDRPAKLHAFLGRQGAIDWPHHVGASWAVMDWETWSREVEPVVEMTSVHGIYETYDPAHAIDLWRAEPKQSRDDSGDKTSIQYALSQGHRFGMVGSSDSHNGISGYRTGMLAVFAPELTRESIVEAWKNRRAYALRGGERILVEFSVNDAFMGGEVRVTGAPRLAAKIAGTAPLERVEIIRDKEFIYTTPGMGPTLQFEYSDNGATRGEHYYYLRISQQGEAYAWSSPVWVTVQ